jgi:hypothetical protein
MVIIQGRKKVEARLEIHQEATAATKRRRGWKNGMK